VSKAILKEKKIKAIKKETKEEISTPSNKTKTTSLTTNNTNSQSDTNTPSSSSLNNNNSYYNFMPISFINSMMPKEILGVPVDSIKKDLTDTSTQIRSL
jgi:hypothetical protein